MVSVAGCARRFSSIAKGARGRGRALAAGLAIAVASLTATGCSASGPVAGPSAAATTSSTTATATGSGAAATGSAVAAGDSECTAPAISSGAGGNGLGHVSLTLVFTDNGPEPCSLQGYPGVALDLPAGGTYNAEQAMTGYMGGDNAQSPAAVSLVPGASATDLIEWVDSPQNGSASFTAADCTGYGASSLVVTAPGQTAPTTIPSPFPNSPVCWGFEVHPVVAGSTGQFPASS